MIDELQSIDWRPAIGDPTVLGWTLVATHAVGAFLCLRAAAIDRARIGYRGADFWQLLAAVLAFLAVNKQLDFQTLLTEIARAAAETNGWHGHRRMVQFFFVYGLLAIGGAGLAVFVLRLRRLEPPRQWAAFGAVSLGLYVLLAAADFHHMEEFLPLTRGWRAIKVALEFSGAALIAVGAVKAGSTE